MDITQDLVKLYPLERFGTARRRSERKHALYIHFRNTEC